MDPLTHTLFGGVLADTGLRRRSGLATATLVVGANLPDIDVVAHFAGMDSSLAWRRGWTHGVLALVVLPVVLTGLVVAFDRWRRRRDPNPHRRGSPVDPARLLPLAALAVASHPLLDWLNTYGVRLLMPFDGRWFYGDALFIVDPWLWLLLGGALFLGRSASPRALAAWAALGVVTTGAVVVGSRGHAWALWLWLAGIVVLATVRAVGGVSTAQRSRWIVRGALAVGVAYMASMVGLSVWAERAAAQDLAAAGVETTAPPRVGPDRIDPSVRLVVAPVAGGYRVGDVRPLRRPRLRLDERLVPLVTFAPAGATTSAKSPVAVADIARAARGARCVQGFVGWMRLPFTVVEEASDGFRVHLLDARYRRGPGDGFGGAEVLVDDALEVTCAVE